MLALSTAALPAFLMPAQERADAARRSEVHAQQQAALQGARDRGSVPPLEEQLAAFYRSFPREQDAADAIGRVAAAALRQGLQLQQADYRVVRDRYGRLVRLQMNLPLRGAYPAIRQFLAALRSEMWPVSLEQVQFERQKVGDPTVEARVRLVFYLGAAS